MRDEVFPLFTAEWALGHYCPWPRDYVPTLETEEKLAGFGLNKTAERDIWLGLPVYEGRVHARHCVLNARLVFVEGEAVVMWRLRGDAAQNTLLSESPWPVGAVVEAVVEGETSVRGTDETGFAWKKRFVK